MTRVYKHLLIVLCLCDSFRLSSEHDAFIVLWRCFLPWVRACLILIHCFLPWPGCFFNRPPLIIMFLDCGLLVHCCFRHRRTWYCYSPYTLRLPDHISIAVSICQPSCHCSGTVTCTYLLPSPASWCFRLFSSTRPFPALWILVHTLPTISHTSLVSTTSFSSLFFCSSLLQHMLRIGQT